MQSESILSQIWANTQLFDFCRQTKRLALPRLWETAFWSPLCKQRCCELVVIFLQPKKKLISSDIKYFDAYF